MRDMTSIANAFKLKAMKWFRLSFGLKPSQCQEADRKSRHGVCRRNVDRTDLDEDSDPATSIADHEAIALAEDLGLIVARRLSG